MVNIGRFLTGKWNGNRYEILYKLGEGGIGSVYKVRDNVGKYRALKLSKEVTSITREYNVLKALEQLECVPKVYEIDDYQRNGEVYYFFVMDFVDGYNLKQFLGKTNIKLKEIIKIGIILLNILEKIYKMGYIYSDIKLENIMLDKNRKNITIIDFGGAVEEQYGVREYTPTYNMLSWGVCLDKKYPENIIFSVTMIMINMMTKDEFNPILNSIKQVIDKLYLLKIHAQLKKVLRKALNGGYNNIDRYIEQLRASMKLCNNSCDFCYSNKVISKYNIIANVVFAIGIILFITAIITGVYLL